MAYARVTLKNVSDNNNNKSCKIHQQKTLILTLTLNPKPRFYQVKLEN